MLWVLSIFLLVIIYALLSPKPTVQEFLDNPPPPQPTQPTQSGQPTSSTQPGSSNTGCQPCAAATDIQGLKNTIDILSVKVDQMKTEMATMGSTVNANKAQLDHYNKLIKQLESQMQEEVKNAS